MSTKNRKNRQNRSSASQSGGFNPAKRTTVSMIAVGVALAIWLAFAPTEWWLGEGSQLIEVRYRLLVLVAASMTLATFLLTTPRSENSYKVIALASTGLVVWLAAFAPVLPADSLSFGDPIADAIVLLKIMGSMILSSSPLAIAFLGPHLSKLSRQNAPFWMLISGSVLLVFAFLLSGTRASLILVLILGVSFAELLVVFLGLAGFLIVLCSIFIGATKLVANGGGLF